MAPGGGVHSALTGSGNQTDTMLGLDRPWECVREFGCAKFLGTRVSKLLKFAISVCMGVTGYPVSGGGSLAPKGIGVPGGGGTLRTHVESLGNHWEIAGGSK